MTSYGSTWEKVSDEAVCVFFAAKTSDDISSLALEHIGVITNER